MLFGLDFCWFFWVSIGFEREIFFLCFFFLVVFLEGPLMRFWYHFFGFKEGWEFLSCYCVGFSGALGLFVKVIQGGFSRSD